MSSSAVQRVLFCLFLFGVLGAAHGELILARFSATNLMKIMPVGDSITDNCVTNGAWRAPLQPLLESNGILFTNVGRLSSSPYTGFSKVKHEGYCGSVIGPPGVYGVYNYTTTNAYLQRIVLDALSIANNRPDLLLILIGANDIGRGRNPWTVATNDMARLLNVIFSNVPNANVILAKTTSLQNADLGYGTFATNVPIYNAALQAMTNQRRAQGQNVFLADMFSAVDYSTMFLNDRLHPNPLGLRAIANEWAARIQAIVVRTNRITSTFVYGGSDWRYAARGVDLGADWTQLDYNDGGWSNGIARLGYGDPTTATQVSYGPDPSNKWVTTYFRRPFVVPWNAVITNLNFRLARTGGAVVWLNGQEIFRANLPSGPITYTNLALTAVTGFAAHIYYPTNVAVAGLPTGTNLLAVEIHQSASTNATLGFDLELIGSGYLLPTPSLSITQAGGTIQVSWPATNTGGFTLYSTTNLTQTGGWSSSASPVFTNAGQVVVTQAPDTSARFYRLQRPSW